VSLFTTATEHPSIRNVPLDESPEALFQKNLIALHAIEIEFADAQRSVAKHLEVHKDGRVAVLNGNLFCRTNALTYDATLQRLGKRLDEVSARRVQLYAEHCALKVATGRAK
jgi:hypothetical protein